MSDFLTTIKVGNSNVSINALIKGIEFDTDAPFDFENKDITDYVSDISFGSETIKTHYTAKSSGNIGNYAICIVGTPINVTTGIDTNIVNVKMINKSGIELSNPNTHFSETFERFYPDQGFFAPLIFKSQIGNPRGVPVINEIDPDPIEIKNILYFEDEFNYNSFKNALEYGGVFNPEFIANWGSEEPEPVPEPEDKDGTTVSGDKGYYFQSVQTKYSGKSGQTYTGLQSQYFERYEFDPTSTRIAFYPTDDSLGSSNKKFQLKGAIGLSCRSKVGTFTSPWKEGQTYRKTSPIYLTGDYKMTNNSYLVSSFSTNIPIFRNEGDADDYISGMDNTDEAINGDNLTDGGIVGNKKPDGTDVNIDFQAFADLDKMVNYYNLGKTTLGQLADALWSGDATELESSTKLVGSNAFNAIASCRFFPMNIADVATLGAVRKVHLGKFDTNVSAATITQNSGTKSFGSYTFMPIHGDFRDYTNVKIAIWLPYIGLNELDPHKYMGKTASLDYFVDITSGACQAVMTVGGAIVDSWVGDIGRQVPITAEDAQSYNTGIRESIASAKNYVIDYEATYRNADFNLQKGVGTMISQGLSGNLGTATGGVAMTALQMQQDIWNVSDTQKKMENQTNIVAQSVINASQNMPTMVCGTAGGFTAQRLPQSVYLFFAVNKSVEPQYTRAMVGKPTGASGPVSMFSGYLEGDVVKVEGYMTDTEREAIAGMLKSGIYV